MRTLATLDVSGLPAARRFEDAQRVHRELALAGIRRLVEQAQTSRSRAQALADRAAALLFYFAVGAGLITMAVWLALGEPDQAIERTVTVLVIACPHALGLAIPLVIAIATGLSEKLTAARSLSAATTAR